MSKNKPKYVLIIAACIGVLALSFVVSSLMHKKHNELEPEFFVAFPWRQNLEIKKEFVAQIKASQHIELRSLEKGYLQNIYVDEGQVVHKGQKMFQIMPLLLEAELKKATAEYQLTKIEYDNTLILKKRNIVSANELALTKAKLDKAHAEMELAQTHLEFSTIKAPFDGIMDRFHVRLGSLVNEGDLLTTLSDNSKMWLYFNVSEADYLDYMGEQKHENGAGSEVELKLANGKIFDQKGKIDTIEADFNNEVGNVAFRATFLNPHQILRHGETGTAILTKKYANALVIPQKATFEVLDKKFVYVVNEKNEVISKQIKIAGELPHLFIIESGVDENDKVLVEGIGKIHLGDIIKTQIQNRDEVLKSLALSTSSASEK